jgi:hypothetical protein
MEKALEKAKRQQAAIAKMKVDALEKAKKESALKMALEEKR